MSKFKRLTIATMPRVMVAILAMDASRRRSISISLNRVSLGKPFTANTLADRFNDLLELPCDQRSDFAQKLEQVLDDMLSQDAFGTEGQNDPRGDHRD